MIGVVIKPVNIRAEMSKTSQDVGDLAVFDVVIGTVLNGWIAFDRVYRRSLNGQPELLNFTRYAAVHEPADPSIKYMMLVDANIAPAPTPTPAPVLPTLNIAIGGEEYLPVNVELKPKT